MASSVTSRSRVFHVRLRRARRRGLLARVAAERSRRGELAELVPDHVFLHEHLQELVPVVHFERVPDELRDDRARAGPGLDGLLGAVLVQLRDLAVELFVYVGAFFCASAHVVLGFLKPAVLRTDARCHALHVHRLRALLVLAELTAAEDQLLAVLPRVPGDAALGGDAGLADRVAAAVGAAFAAAHRVVDRVHRLGTGVRAVAHVALPAGLADADVDVVEVPELTDRRAARRADAAHFTGRQDHDDPLAFLRTQPGNAAGGANELAALAGVHLDVVDLEAAG